MISFVRRVSGEATRELCVLRTGLRDVVYGCDGNVARSFKYTVYLHLGRVRVSWYPSLLVQFENFPEQQHAGVGDLLPQGELLGRGTGEYVTWHDVHQEADDNQQPQHL